MDHSHLTVGDLAYVRDWLHFAERYVGLNNEQEGWLVNHAVHLISRYINDTRDEAWVTDDWNLGTEKLIANNHQSCNTHPLSGYGRNYTWIHPQKLNEWKVRGHFPYHRKVEVADLVFVWKALAIAERYVEKHCPWNNWDLLHSITIVKEYLKQHGALNEAATVEAQKHMECVQKLNVI